MILELLSPFYASGKKEGLWCVTSQNSNAHFFFYYKFKALYKHFLENSIYFRSIFEISETFFLTINYLHFIFFHLYLFL